MSCTIRLRDGAAWLIKHPVGLDEPSVVEQSAQVVSEVAEQQDWATVRETSPPTSTPSRASWPQHAYATGRVA
jgi:hypothetical protein